MLYFYEINNMNCELEANKPDFQMFSLPELFKIMVEFHFYYFTTQLC